MILMKLKEIEGDCQEAIASYGKVVEVNPNTQSTRVHIARCQLALGDPEEAETTLIEVLRRTPAYPSARYQLALVYEETGRTDEAIEQVDAALEVWKNADPDYKLAQRARELRARL